MVPNIEPTIVANESENNALPALGNLLFFMIPACVATATKVPAVSKKSINRLEKKFELLETEVIFNAK